MLAPWQALGTGTALWPRDPSCYMINLHHRCGRAARSVCGFGGGAADRINWWE
jgi:hypothetical protein